MALILFANFDSIYSKELIYKSDAFSRIFIVSLLKDKCSVILLSQCYGLVVLRLPKVPALNT